MPQPQKAKADEELKTAELAVKSLESQLEAEAENKSTPVDNAQQDAEVKNDAPVEQASDEFSPGKVYEQLASKKGFKTPDDLAKSYENLEARANRVEQMAREALKKATEAKEPDVVDDNKEALEVLRGVVRDELRESLRPLREDKDRQVVDNEISEVKSRHPDFNGPIVADAIKLAAEGRAKNLEDAYRILTYDIMAERAFKQSRRDDVEIQKKSAVVESANQAAGNREIDYGSMTLEELEEVLPKAGDFIDSKGKYRRVD